MSSTLCSPAPTSNPFTPIGGGGPVNCESLLRAPGSRVHLATPPARNSSTVQGVGGVDGEEVDNGANVDRIMARLRRPRFKPARHRTVNPPMEDPFELVDNTVTVNAFAGVRAPPPRVASFSGAAILPEHFEIFIDPTGEMGVDGPPGVNTKAKKSRRASEKGETRREHCAASLL
jgi:hypothetical protein